jgi:hypothetical protein
MARAISHKTAAWWLNAITGIAAVIALATMFVLICTLVDVRKATVEANRAWIAPHTAFLRREFKLNDHLAFRIPYDNVGRRPARSINFFSGAYIVDANLLLRSLSDPSLTERVFQPNLTCVGHTIRAGAEIIWPSANNAYSQSSLDDDRYPVITQRVINGDDAVVVLGCFLYETFGEVHQSMFCFWFRQAPPKDTLTITEPAAICPSGNDAT